MGKSSGPDRAMPYMTILVQKGRMAGAQHVHAGLARHGIGTPFCDDNKRLFEFWIAAREENFALYRTAGWRHRWAEAFLEQNRGCQRCLHVMYEIGREAGYAKPRSLRS